ncbi:hypothetical protein V1460_30795 [Streptomyces sp. SCSIO 30461]|uniref:hypothetical protein n=1 Tax=Streptomyces sp. SCSIO 30461 TaxID=3118085 RepID=UPI0030D29B62
MDSSTLTPAGAWTVQVSRPGGTYPGVLHFTTDGRVFLASGGAGSWRATGGASVGRFAFRIAEPVFDGTGACTGWVDIVQRATLDGDAFSSTGTAVVYDREGRADRQARVGISARRTS